MARNYLEQSVDFDAASARAGDFWTEMDNLMIHEQQNQAPLIAGYAADCVVSVALFDESFDPDNPHDNTQDEDLDPYEWDAAYYAAMVYAGGASWNEASSPARRREFWEWYLREAVPAAANAAIGRGFG